MTEQDHNSGDLPATDQPSRGSNERAVGYCRPPMHSRFKPGQSGNPKGRRKGARNLVTLRRELYLAPVQVREGNRTKRIPRALAVDVAVMNRALKGDAKAAQFVTKTIKELRVYDDSFPVDTGYPMNLTRGQMALLNDEDLAAMTKILARAHGIADTG